MSIDYDRERFFLEEFLKSIKYLKRNLGTKMELTGWLTDLIANELGMQSHALFFSGYYANVGMIALDHLISHGGFIGESEKNLIKQHVNYSAEFVENRGLIECIDIIKKHHEKPNGGGYFGEVNRNKEALIVNIADEFIGSSTPNGLRPPLPRKVAIFGVLETFRQARTFAIDEIKAIESVLEREHRRIAEI